MSIRKIAAVIVASTVLAGGFIIGGGAPAQAANCNQDTIIFSFVGGTGVASDPNQIGCAGSPEVEFNTNLIYPGSRAIKSRYRPGVASSYCLVGDFLGAYSRCGAAVQSEGLVPGTYYYESPTIAHPAASIGCVSGWWNVGQGAQYCTITHLQP